MYASAYAWAKIISYLEERLTEVVVSSWLDDTEVIELSEEKLTIYSPSDFRQEVIRERCAPHIQDAMRDLFHKEVKLEVWGDAELREYRQQKKDDNPIFFNKQFTFDSFVSGQCNDLAVKVAKAASANPGQDLYNPLFIYGPPGVGKTHLLYAVANNVIANLPNQKVIYIHADQFTNELVRSIMDGKMEEFKNKYRTVDVFLIDDIQFIAGKSSTQEEFFHTFNVLFEHKKQIVMTADRRPGELATLEERLQSRFGSGIMVGITPPDKQMRLEIIRAKATRLNLILSEDVVSYMADNLTDNVRQIEGALKKVRAFHELTGMELSLTNVSRTIEDICVGELKMPVTASLVIRNVCKYYGVTEETLKGSQRSRGVAEPRQVAMYLIRRLVNESFSNIGKLFERDHGTVHHAVKKVEDTLKLKGNPLDGVLQDIISNIENTVC